MRLRPCRDGGSCGRGSVGPHWRSPCSVSISSSHDGPALQAVRRREQSDDHHSKRTCPPDHSDQPTGSCNRGRYQNSITSIHLAAAAESLEPYDVVLAIASDGGWSWCWTNAEPVRDRGDAAHGPGDL